MIEFLRRRWLLPVLLLALPLPWLRAQETGAAVPYAVACVAVAVEVCAAALPATLRDTLAAAGVHLRVTVPADPQVRLWIDVDGAALTLRRPPRRATETLSLSPLLAQQVDFAVTLPRYRDRAALTALLAGSILYDVDRCAAAGPYLAQGPAAGAGRAAARYYQAACALLAGDTEAAIHRLRDVPDLGRLYAQSTAYPALLAWAYLQTGQREAAFAVLDELVAVRQTADDASVGTALAKRAQFHALAFDYAAALVDVAAALDGAGDDAAAQAELYRLRGEIHLYLYEWEAARADFNRALALNPADAEAYFQRGILQYTLIERVAALADFRRYVALAPQGRYAAAAARYIASLRLEIDASGDG